MNCPHCGKKLTKSELAAALGASTSEAKRRAARENGKKGGRPKALCYLTSRAARDIGYRYNSGSAIEQGHGPFCYCGEPATRHVFYGSGCGNVCDKHPRILPPNSRVSKPILPKKQEDSK